MTSPVNRARRSYRRAKIESGSDSAADARRGNVATFGARYHAVRAPVIGSRASMQPAVTEPIVDAPPRRRLGFELVIVTVLALAMLLPGVWRYSLVDPWETHYAEVSRRMLADHDWVHTDWQHEGFRSK